MTYQDAIRKINKLLGLHKFNAYKLKDSGNELILDGELAIGEPIYIISQDGQIPASNGNYELEDTTKIKVEDGKVQEIKYDMEKKESFVEAMLKDGTVVKSPTFDVGEDVKVVSPDGQEAPAPDGEHEVALKDSEGKEVIIKIITKDGKITERENVELPAAEEEKEAEEMGMIPELSEGNDDTDEFKKQIMAKIDAIMGKMEDMVNNYEDMKAKVAKFSKEPAGQPINQPKNVITEMNAHKSDAFSQLLKIRHGLDKNKK
jgi:hypothetical protein